MKRSFMATVWKEDDWYVAQALEADVASQGETVDIALSNLREALELYFTPPVDVASWQLHRVEVDIAAG